MYFKDFIGSNLAALNAGKIETKIVIMIEQTEIRICLLYTSDAADE